MLDRHTENACVRDPDSARDDHHPYEDDSHVDRQPHRYPLRRFHSLAPFKPRHMVDQSGAGRGDVGHTAVRVVAVVVLFGPRRELTTTAILLTIWAVWSSQRQPGLNLRREPTLSDERPFEVLAMAHDRRRHPWVRRIAIAFALVAGYVVLGALTFQDNPNDPPLIVALLSK